LQDLIKTKVRIGLDLGELIICKKKNNRNEIA